MRYLVWHRFGNDGDEKVWVLHPGVRLLFSVSVMLRQYEISETYFSFYAVKQHQKRHAAQTSNVTYKPSNRDSNREKCANHTFEDQLIKCIAISKPNVLSVLTKTLSFSCPSVWVKKKNALAMLEMGKGYVYAVLLDEEGQERDEPAKPPKTPPHMQTTNRKISSKENVWLAKEWRRQLKDVLVVSGVWMNPSSIHSSSSTKGSQWSSIESENF